MVPGRGSLPVLSLSVLTLVPTLALAFAPDMPGVAGRSPRSSLAAHSGRGARANAAWVMRMGPGTEQVTRRSMMLASAVWCARPPLAGAFDLPKFDSPSSSNTDLKDERGRCAVYQRGSQREGSQGLYKHCFGVCVCVCVCARARVPCVCRVSLPG